MTSETPLKPSAEERAERAERMAREGAKAMADHHAALRAIDERTIRLRALRLAKEAEEVRERTVREARAVSTRKAPAAAAKRKAKV